MRKTDPGPSGCGENPAILHSRPRRWTRHSLRARLCLAGFSLATPPAPVVLTGPIGFTILSCPLHLHPGRPRSLPSIPRCLSPACDWPSASRAARTPWPSCAPLPSAAQNWALCSMPPTCITACAAPKPTPTWPLPAIWLRHSRLPFHEALLTPPPKRSQILDPANPPKPSKKPLAACAIAGSGSSL